MFELEQQKCQILLTVKRLKRTWPIFTKHKITNERELLCTSRPSIYWFDRQLLLGNRSLIIKPCFNLLVASENNITTVNCYCINHTVFLEKSELQKCPTSYSETHTNVRFSKTLRINALQSNFYVNNPKLSNFVITWKLQISEFPAIGKITAKINKYLFRELLREFNYQTKYILRYRIPNTGRPTL